MPTNPSAGDNPNEPIVLDLPETLTGLSDEDLGAALQLRVDTFQGLRDHTISLNDGESIVEVGTQIATQVEAIRAEQDRRAEDAAQVAAALDSIASRLTPVADAPAETAVPDAPAPAAEAVVDVVEVVADDQALVPVAASANPAGLPAVRAISVRPKAFSSDIAPAGVEGSTAVDTLTPVLTASVDYNLGAAGGRRMVTMGKEISLTELGFMAAEAHRTSGTANNDGKLYLGKMTLPFSDDLVLSDDPVSNGEKFEALIRSVNAPGSAALTAAVACGHCIPAPRILDFCDISSVDGLLVLPTMRADRGGLQWVQSPTLADWMTKTANMWWTVANDCDDEDTKTIIEIDCPGMQAVCEVEAHYMNLRFKNMVARSWPELYRHNLVLGLKAHQYQQNLRRITQVLAAVTGSTIALPLQPDGAFAVIARAIELAVVDSRDRYATDLDFVFEVVMPTWVKPLIRSDIARRDGRPFQSVTDQEIVNEFSIRGARVQFIRGWQSMGAPTPATAYPTQLDFLLYPAGALVEIDQGTLDLGMEIRDNASNARNEFGGFFESFSKVCHPCFDIRRYSLAVCDSGAVGARVDICGQTDNDED